MLTDDDSFDGLNVTYLKRKHPKNRFTIKMAGDGEVINWMGTTITGCWDVMAIRNHIF